MNAILVGDRTSRILEPHDLKSRAHAYLRGGLCLSGVLHVALVFLFLALTRQGEVELIETISKETWVNPPPGILVKVPPPPSRNVSSHQELDPRNRVPDPVERVELPKIDFNEPIGPITGDPSPGRNGKSSSNDPTPSGTEREAPQEPEVYWSNAVDVPPVAIEAPIAKYPEWALQTEVTGKVVLHVLVGTDGLVKQVVVHRGVRGLNEDAKAMLYRWKFRPASMHGRPVFVWVEIPVVFRL